MALVFAYIAAALVFFGLDMVWLGGVAKGLYQSQLAGLIREKPDVLVAGLFYACYLAGVLYFAVAPALAGGGLAKALVNGALLGLIAYGTYDATNLSTLKGYPATIAIVDTLWGTALTAIAAGAGYLAAARFG